MPVFSFLPQARRSALAVLAGMALVLAGCAQLAGPRSVVFSEGELQQMLERKFPLDRRMLEVMEVKVSQPQLRLLPERNRLTLDLQADATDRLFANALHGRLALESGLRLDPRDASIRLTQVRVTAFTLDKDGASPRVPLQRLGALVAETLLEDAAIHQLKPEQMERLTRAGYQPGSIEITPAGIVISVVPR
ncbi:MAG TPA: hypothetical protein VLA16_15890 [Ideonella sp.]|nr:hypothetical protein [Ideonella sp.]